MYKICKTEQSLKRQKLFQTTLLSLMEQKNYQDITVTSLCKEMDIPRKTFYRYFNTLDDVLNMILDEALTNSFLYLEITTDLTGYLNYWKKEKYLLDVLEENRLSSLLVTKSQERLTAFRKDGAMTNHDIMYSAYIAALFTILLSWHHSGMQQSVEEITSLVYKMFRFD